jgi:hypothetical protein
MASLLLWPEGLNSSNRCWPPKPFTTWHRLPYPWEL